LPDRWSPEQLIDGLQRLLCELENEPLLLEPDQLRQRLEALDRLDAYFPLPPQVDDGSIAAGLYPQARAIRAMMEAANGELFQAIRSEIQRGERPDTLLRFVHSSTEMEAEFGPVDGLGYDYLDELISGVFQFEEPSAEPAHVDPEMVPYQPTPARHIFSMIRLTALSASDVVVDLGCGLGHVSLLVAVCMRAQCVGIELQASYVERARQCARRLKLKNVSFLHQDARAADLSAGTVFYLHTPFTGSILARVLERLRREANARSIRICTYGPCTPVVAQEPWLEAAGMPEIHRIAVFSSRI
jgi:hypothetical protein